jgi:histidine triad (HIT) family protein
MIDCIFCEIANGNARAKIVYEDEKFIAFENINPRAPVHILVIPKDHIEKKDAMEGKVPCLWGDLMIATYKVIQQFELDKTGYRLVVNGAGYNAIYHEHVHVMGGKDWRPKDQL